MPEVITLIPLTDLLWTLCVTHIITVLYNRSVTKELMTDTLIL